MTDLLTGNQVEINAITRAKSEEKQKIFSNLPQKTQEMLISKPTFFKVHRMMLKIGCRQQKISPFSTKWHYLLRWTLRGDAK